MMPPKKTYKRLTPELVARMQMLIRDFPELTNEEIGKLVPTSSSTVGAERKGIRTPKTDARKKAFSEALEKVTAPTTHKPMPIAYDWAPTPENTNSHRMAAQRDANDALAAHQAKAFTPPTRPAVPMPNPVEITEDDYYRNRASIAQRTEAQKLDEITRLRVTLRLKALKALQEGLERGTCTPEDVLAALDLGDKS